MLVVVGHLRLHGHLLGGLVLVDGLEGHEAPGGDQLRLELEVDALPGQRVTRQALEPSLMNKELDVHVIQGREYDVPVVHATIVSSETVAVFELPLKVPEAGEGVLLGRRGGVEVGGGRAP